MNGSKSDEVIVSSIRELAPKGIVFDLDNTLYFEGDFYLSAMREVSDFFSTRLGEETASRLTALILEARASGQTKDVFQVALELAGGRPSDTGLIVQILETHQVPGGLLFRDWVPQILSLSGTFFGVLTNGNPVVQRNKINNLRPAEWLRDISVVYANTISPKPNPAGLHELTKRWDVNPSEVVLVGDSDTDRLCAENAGCHFVSAI